MAGTTTSSRDNAGLPGGARRDMLVNFNKLVDDVSLKLPLAANSTAAVNASTTETDLMSYTVAASKLATAGDIIEVVAWGSTANNANVKTLKIYWAGSAVHSITQTSSILGKWTASLRVIKTGASTQDWATSYHEGVTANGTLKGAVDVGTATGTDTGTLVLKFTGTSNTAASDVIQEGMIVRFFATATELTAAKIGDMAGTAITT